MILVTGAAGKTGRAVARQLVSRGQMVRALVHRREQVLPVEELGVQDVIVGELCSAATMERAARGVRAVYHICPNMSPDEVIIGEVSIAAARAADVACFVYHSVLHPQIAAMPHHWLKLRVEEMLFESGLAFTILQPAAYMQNLLAHWDRISEQGVYPVPYAIEARLSMVDLEDVAASAAAVLTQPGHSGATYELVGEEVLSQIEVAGVLSQQLRRPVSAHAVSLADWERGARAAGLGDYQVETLLKMFRYYERYGFWGNSRVLEGLLDRKPATLAAFVMRTMQERQGQQQTS
jgi:NAD(P)H dehydrogenase (quinone)